MSVKIRPPRAQIALFTKRSIGDFNSFGLVGYSPQPVEVEEGVFRPGFLLVTADPREKELHGSTHLNVHSAEHDFNLAVENTLANGWELAYKGTPRVSEDICQTACGLVETSEGKFMQFWRFTLSRN